MTDTLTRESILAMQPGPELCDLLATRVMGWHRHHDLGWITEAGENRYKSSWNPTLDIAAAMEVVAKMESDGWGHKHLKYSRVAAPSWTFFLLGEGPKSICESEADTIALAISRAAALTTLETRDD